MNYDFDTIIARRGTDCEKWDLPAEDGVLPLWVADMDFRAAPAIVDALCRRVEEGVFGYALPSGSWHESLVRWLNVRHRWQVSSDTVIDAIGVVPALASVIRAFCSPGDKVIVQTPAYNCFFATIRNQGCDVLENPLRRVPVREDNEGDFTYEMDFEDLERKVADPRVKLFLLCNPHNPTGRAWTAEELRTVGEICLRHGVFVASDEIHADLRFAYILVRVQGVQPCWTPDCRHYLFRSGGARAGASFPQSPLYGRNQSIRFSRLICRMGQMQRLARRASRLLA